MSHHLVKTGYEAFVERLNRFPQGAVPNETFYRILKILFNEQEAARLALLPLRPFTARRAARIWKVSEKEAETLLEGLAERGLLLDLERDGVSRYLLPPPMIGFLEFSLMRLRGDVDQKALSELLHQYVRLEDDFLMSLFVDGRTQVGRVFVHEPALEEKPGDLLILDYERATAVIEGASHRAVSLCFCRHKALHLGEACGAPLEICLTFNSPALSLVKHRHARTVSREECLDLLRLAWENKLVQFGSNVREGVGFICNCCGCCCEAMGAARRFGLLRPIHTTNFLPVMDDKKCTGCGDCVRVCPVGAVALATAHDPRKKKRMKARLDEDLCLGCGLCARECRFGAVKLVNRPQRVIPPLNTVHQTVLMAVERGKLQDLLFDDRTLTSHRVMAAVLGAILRLPPVKRAMASRQVASKYLEALLSHPYVAQRTA